MVTQPLVAATARRRQAQPRSLTQSLCNNILKAEGLKYVEHGLSFDLRLRILHWFLALTIDWVHTFLQNGVFTVEATIFVQALMIPASDLRTFFQLPWMFSHHMQHKGKQLHRIFSTYRLNDKGEIDKIKASASELLGMYSLLRHYVNTQVTRTDTLEPNFKSFEACCSILDLIQAAKTNKVPTASSARELFRRISNFMRLHTGAYGTQHLLPKHAWQWALGEHWLRDDVVLDQLVVERLHLLVKETAGRVTRSHFFGDWIFRIFGCSSSRISENMKQYLESEGFERSPG